jgi:hypothetical protein
VSTIDHGMTGVSAEDTPTTSSSAWGLRYPGLPMRTDDGNQVSEFTGMWPLKPDADLVAITKHLAPGGWVEPAGASFSEQTTKLGLIRTARWFVAKTQYFDGYTLIFVSQFDSSVEKYFDDFTLNGKANLAAIWGDCIGCPTGPDDTVRDIVEYIARGQVKTLACYDVAPSISIAQLYKHADWYEKTQRFQRAVAKGDGSLEEHVDAFLSELAEPAAPVPSGAAVDTDVARETQYELPQQRG